MRRNVAGNFVPGSASRKLDGYILAQKPDARLAQAVERAQHAQRPKPAGT